MRRRIHRGGLWRVVLGVPSVILLSQSPSWAFDGLSSQSELLHPGKADAHYRLRDDADEYNLIGWSPIAKGGWGIIDFDGKRRTDYAGVFVRPLQPWPERGELILGFQHVGTNTADDHEMQGEYRLPFGLGLGGGFVERRAGGLDVRFGKLSYRNRWAGWNYIATVQGQSVDEVTSPGGYAALYSDQLMLTYGNDGEQWRTAVGYITPETPSPLRPAAEVLYVDNVIGRHDGVRFLFANASLKYQGGFLSHPSRLGRAMGPTGLEFGNPLGYLEPTWNRRLDVWELGGLADARLVWTKSPVGGITWRTDALVFPFQFDRQDNVLDACFAGWFYSHEAENSPGVLGGIFRKLGFLQVGIGVEHNFETTETRVDVGIIDTF